MAASWRLGTLARAVDPFGRTPLPERGRPRTEVLDELTALKDGDRDWRSGKVFSLVYSAGERHHRLLGQALGLSAAENVLDVLAFPSIGRLQHDLVRNTASLLGARLPDGCHRHQRNTMEDASAQRTPRPTMQPERSVTACLRLLACVSSTIASHSS